MQKIYYRVVTFFIFSFLFYSSLFAQSDSLASEISLKTVLENDNVPLNQEVVYHIELSWHGDLSQYKIGDIGDPVITNLSLRGSGSSNRLTTDKDGQPLSIKRVTYYFKPQSMGMAYIDGITIQYTDSHSGKSETLSAQRIGVKITDPVATSQDTFMPGTILLWILLIGFIAALAYFLFRYMQRRKKSDEDETPVLTMEEKYLELLNETIHLSNGVAKENISALKKLLSGYIAEKFSHTDKVDISVIKESLAQLKLEPELIKKVAQMHDKAELAQFAGENIELSEIHIFYDTIEHILNKVNEEEKINTGD